MLAPFAKDIWIAEGPVVAVAGFGYGTRTAIIRLSGGGLFVWSPIALDQELKSHVDALGPVHHIVAPNTLHHMFVGEWQRAYPNASSHALPELREKRADLRWDDELGDAPEAAWAQDIDQVVLRLTPLTSEVVFFHRPSRTAIFTDLIQHFEPGWVGGWRAVVARLDLLTATRPTVPRKFRIAFTGRARARKALRRIMAWPTERLLAAHAPPIASGGREAIAHAFAWLMRGRE